MSTECTKLHVLALGVALGLVMGLSVFVIGLLAMVGYGVEIVNTIGSVYVGYSPTFGGVLLGLFYGFIDGFIGGVLIAFFYNCTLKCSGLTSCSKTE